MLTENLKESLHFARSLERRLKTAQSDLSAVQVDGIDYGDLEQCFGTFTAAIIRFKVDVLEQAGIIEFVDFVDKNNPDDAITKMLPMTDLSVSNGSLSKRG